MNLNFDNDGVLADFDRHCKAMFGKYPNELEDVELWRLVNQDREAFWSGIPVKDGAHELFAIGAPFNPTIITGCPRNGDIRTEICPVASEHKKKWVATHFGDHIKVITCFSRDKPLHMVQEGDLLVDDMYLNIKRWKKAGGRAIWYQNAEQAISDLKRKLEINNEKS